MLSAAVATSGTSLRATTPTPVDPDDRIATEVGANHSLAWRVMHSPWTWVVAGGVAAAAVGAAIAAIQHGPHQLAFVLRHPGKPWLAGEARAVSAEAHTRVAAIFGTGGHIDDAGDAFRHAWSAGSMTLDAIAQHGVRPDRARALVEAAGAAHEADGAFNPKALSSAMDLFNNHAGAALVGDGRTAAGAWLTHADVQERVLDAMRSGALRVLDDAGQMIQTTAAMIPR